MPYVICHISHVVCCRLLLSVVVGCLGRFEYVWVCFNLVLIALESVLILAVSCLGILGYVWVCLGIFESCCHHVGIILDPCWVLVGSIWASWDYLGRLLGVSWTHVCLLLSSLVVSKNLMKTNQLFTFSKKCVMFRYV